MQYTRLTFFGSRRTADIVLPDDEPVGTLLPEVLDLLDEPPAPDGALSLVTTVGDVIDPDLSLQTQDIAQGTMLRVVATDDAPQSPEIADVTDTVSLARASRRDVWTPLATITAASAGAAITSFYTAWAWAGLAPQSIPILLATSLALLVLSVLSVRRGAKGPAAVLAAVTVATAVSALGAATVDLSPVLRLCVVLGALWLVIGGVLGVGARRPSAIAGAVLALGNVLAVGAATVLLPSADPTLVATLTAIANLVVLGFLPGIAAAASGLTRYDDLVITGQPASRGDVEAVVEDAFAALTWCVLAVMVPFALAVHVLFSGGQDWGIALAASICVVALLRTRVLPLILQRAIVLLTVTAAVGTWFVQTTWFTDPTKLTAALLLTALLVVLTLVSPSEVTRARLRRWMGTAELLAALAVLPSALGVLGIFSDLYGVFR